jgi:hypothetical protein
MINGYISIKNIISTLYRDLGVNTEINESDLVEWSAEALSLIGAYSQYIEISKCLTLKKGKAALPIGFQKLVDVRYNGKPLYWATNTNANNYQCDGCQLSVCNNNESLTFYINDNYIITNIKNEINSDLCMVFLSLPVDDEGWPMIPDSVYYSKAIVSYIIERLDFRQWRKGKIPDKVYQKSEQDWLFYVNSARGDANMPNLAQLENLKNIMTRLVPLRNDYSRGFKNISKRERLNLN